MSCKVSGQHSCRELHSRPSSVTPVSPTGSGLSELAKRLANSPSSPSQAGTGSTSTGSTRTVDTIPRTVPSCWWNWPFGCGATQPLPASNIAASAEAWEDAEEVVRVESALRETIADTDPHSLEVALRWAKAVVGVDRELMILARRRLPNLRCRDRVLRATRSSDVGRLEEVIEQASWVGVDAEIIDRAKVRLATLQLDWLPLHSFNAQDLHVAADPSTPMSHRECTICLETYREYDTQTFLPCCHRFHAHCAKRWLARRSECPVCSHTAVYAASPWPSIPVARHAVEVAGSLAIYSPRSPCCTPEVVNLIDRWRQ